MDSPFMPFWCVTETNYSQKYVVLCQSRRALLRSE